MGGHSQPKTGRKHRERRIAEKGEERRRKETFSCPQLPVAGLAVRIKTSWHRATAGALGRSLWIRECRREPHPQRKEPSPEPAWCPQPVQELQPSPHLPQAALASSTELLVINDSLSVPLSVPFVPTVTVSFFVCLLWIIGQ